MELATFNFMCVPPSVVATHTLYWRRGRNIKKEFPQHCTLSWSSLLLADKWSSSRSRNDSKVHFPYALYFWLWNSNWKFPIILGFILEYLSDYSRNCRHYLFILPAKLNIRFILRRLNWNVYIFAQTVYDSLSWPSSCNWSIHTRHSFPMVPGTFLAFCCVLHEIFACRMTKWEPIKLKLYMRNCACSLRLSISCRARMNGQRNPAG